MLFSNTLTYKRPKSPPPPPIPLPSTSTLAATALSNSLTHTAHTALATLTTLQNLTPSSPAQIAAETNKNRFLDPNLANEMLFLPSPKDLAETAQAATDTAARPHSTSFAPEEFSNEPSETSQSKIKRAASTRQRPKLRSFHSHETHVNASEEHAHISLVYSRLFDSKLSPFTPHQELAVSALFRRGEAMHALGFSKVREAFPESEKARLKKKSTADITDDVERFGALFPPDRYGANRTKKVFSDTATFFHDLDPLVAARRREARDRDEEEARQRRQNGRESPQQDSPGAVDYHGRSPKKREASVFDMDPEYAKMLERRAHALSRATSGKLKRVATDNNLEKQDSILLKRVDLIREFDEKEMLEQTAGHFPSKTDIFSQRVSTILTRDDGDIGKQDYVHACAVLEVAPNAYFLNNICRSHVDLQFASVTPTDFKAMCVPLKCNKFITHLNLTDNQIGDVIGETLVHALRDGSPITDLLLAGNYLATKTGLAIAAWFAAGNGSLIILDLSRNLLTDKSMVTLSASLGACLTLKELLLSENSFTTLVAPVPSLTTLSLNTNPLDNKLLSSMTDRIVQSHLTVLDLSLASLGDTLGAAIATILAVNQHSLRNINGSFNKLTSESASKIAKGLATNDWLQVLMLDGNFFGLEGVLEIVDALGDNTKLMKLTLTGSATDLSEVATPLWQRNWGGVSKELEARAFELMTKATEDEVQEEYEALVKAAEEMQLLNPKKKVKKPKPPKKPKAKKPKKGAKPDKSPIPREFFLLAANEAEELKKKEAEELKLQAARRASVGGKGGKKGGKNAIVKKAGGAELVGGGAVLEEKAVAANPVSWQNKMGVIERSKIVVEREELSKLFWLRVRKALNKRELGCEVEGYAFDNLIG